MANIMTLFDFQGAGAQIQNCPKSIFANYSQIKDAAIFKCNARMCLF